MSWLPPAYVGFIFFTAASIFAAAGAPVFGDPDTAWHLATGDTILATSEIPMTDEWSFSAHGEAWYNIAWLFDGLLSLLEKIGGLSLIYSLTIAGYALALAAMAHHTIARGAGVTATLAISLVVLLVVFTGVIARPTLCSTLLTLTFYCTLTRYAENKTFRCLIFLPIWMMFWVNLHGGFVMGFALIGLFAAEALIRKDWKTFHDMTLLGGCCLIASIINPLGLGIYYSVLVNLTGAYQQSFVLEWKAVEIGHHVPMTFLLLLMLAVGNPADKTIALRDRVLAIGLMMLALTGARHAQIASLLMMPYLALSLTHSLVARPSGEQFLLRNRAVLADMRKPESRAVGSVMALAMLALISIPTTQTLLNKHATEFDPTLFPGDEAEYISTHYPYTRFFNDYNLGGYLVYLWQGSPKVFIDGRATSLYSPTIMADYYVFASQAGFGSNSERIARQYQFDGLIVANDDSNAADWHWNTHWKAVYRGKVATVYIKNE